MHDLQLKMTCSACPEQYDVFYKDTQVGYLRLRHGIFTAHCRDVHGDLVYEANTKGDGLFDEDEREYHLNKALDAIQDELNISGS